MSNRYRPPAAIAQDGLGRILLARHGESTFNAKKRVSGRLDPELSDRGRRQARRLRKLLAATSLDSIYASPLRRAIETARPTAEEHGLAIEPVQALIELDFGALSGRYRDDRDPEAAALWGRWQREKVTWRHPGGESLADLENRLRPWLVSLLASGPRRNTLIVAHRQTNRALLGLLLGWERADWAAQRIRHRRLLVIELGKNCSYESLPIEGRIEGFGHGGSAWDRN